MTDTERRVLRAIQQAYPHAIRKNECAPISPRAFKAAVHELRAQKYPIASDGNGYWLAQTPQELRDTSAWLLSQIASVASTRAVLEEMADSMEAPQVTLFGAA